MDGNRSVMAARRGPYYTFFGFVLAKKVRTDPAPAVTDPITMDGGIALKRHKVTTL